MLAEEGAQSHRFTEIVSQFPSNIQLEKFLFQDESLLWAERLPIKYRFRSLGVLLCLICAGIFIILGIHYIITTSSLRHHHPIVITQITFVSIDIIILAVGYSPMAFVVASLALPLIVLPLRYALHRVIGSHVQVITNYRYFQIYF